MHGQPLPSVFLQACQCSARFWPGGKPDDSVCRIDHHCHLAKQATVAQALLNILGLNSKTANLDLFISAATQFDAFLRPFRQVAAAISLQHLPIGQCQCHERIVGQRRCIRITQAYARADNVQVAHYLFIYGLQVPIEDQHLAVGDGKSNIAMAVTSLEYPMGHQHSGLGRPIEVM